ncbi:MAG: glutamyl-tRNA reductase, partial [Actinomycetota bacterium]
MPIVIIGVSHKTAPIAVREKLSFPPEAVGENLDRLLMYPSVSEAVILSTCNRTEVYCVADDADRGRDDIAAFLAQTSGIKLADLENHLYGYVLERAIHHLFRVVSSLDSMVLGEAQIQGQIKEAYTLAREAEATDSIFNKLFENAIRVGKRARS